jgi:predicted transposase YbfD/YdcC
LDKGHGRIERRELWCASTDPATVGLAGVAQVVRIDRHTEHVRKGLVTKETHETAFGVTTFWSDEAGPEPLLQIARDHWSIENGQHYRRDRTQDEDRCTVGETNSARNLSLFRSLAIFLVKRQAEGQRGKKSLPDFQARNHSHPWALIRRFTDQPQE